jgi:predicted aconitase with swiveling domain
MGTSLQTFWLALVAKVKAALPVIESVVASEAEAFLSSIAQIALGAVITNLPLVASGTEKFGAAVASTVQQVEAQGKTIAISDAQSAVQAAHDHLLASVTG